MTTPTTDLPGSGTVTGAAASTSPQYLVISAGLDDNHDGVIDEGGKVLAFPLTPIEGVTAEMILKMLGVTDGEIHAEVPVTLPAYRLNILGLIINDKPLTKNFEVEVQIVNETGLRALKSAASINVTL